MPSLLVCPWIARWQLLRDVSLAAEQQELFESHLESCPVCQERLDQAEEDETALVSVARQLGDPTLAPPDVTLGQLLERLQEANGAWRTTPGEPPDLYFLCPSDRPEVLGTLGGYEVLEVIGQGGMGVVLKAFDPTLQRLVAIKVLAAAVAGSVIPSTKENRRVQQATLKGQVR
jgi:serine/threonine-protein kinase